jgi:polysaccharide export outer membrane protein
MQKGTRFTNRVIYLIFIVSIMISCVPVKKLTYFNDIDEMQDPVVNPKVQKLIMPFDKLYIKVYSIDEKTRQLFNASESVSMSSSASIIGYIVDEAGDINFPFTGKINVGGLTLLQANSKIEKALNEYVSNATVNVKFIDNNVTIMGEVVRQGMYTFTQDKLNVYEALALGGGISQYGNRKNVILIRQEGDKIMHHRLDLSNSRISGKDNYYILPNDVIVVEPMKSISTSYGNNTYSLLLSTISTLITVVLFIKLY